MDGLTSMNLSSHSLIGHGESDFTYQTEPEAGKVIEGILDMENSEDSKVCLRPNYPLLPVKSSNTQNSYIDNSSHFISLIPASSNLNDPGHVQADNGHPDSLSFQSDHVISIPKRVHADIQSVPSYSPVSPGVASPPLAPPSSPAWHLGPDGSKPQTVILEQPASNKHRFRYEVEGRGAGAILGVSATEEKKTFPSIQVLGYVGPARVVVSLVTHDGSLPKAHPHWLVSPGKYVSLYTIGLRCSLYCFSPERTCSVQEWSLP